MGATAEHAEQPPSVPVDLRADGVLWLINRTVFHPRGFALAIDPETRDLSLLGDGTEPWQYAEAMTDTEDALFAAAEALLQRARVDNG